MSFSFSIAAKNPLKYQDLLDQLGKDAKINCCEQDSVGEFLTGIRHFYIPGVTCRTPEVALEQAGYSVRILACAAPEDYHLAFKIAQSIASLSGVEITGEDGQQVTADDLPGKYNAEWINADIDGGLEFLLSTARSSSSGLVNMSGAKRDFYIGPRLAQELLGLGDRQLMLAALFEKMRITQYFDETEYYMPSVKSFPGSYKKFVVWGSDVQYYFPWVQYFAVVVDEANPPLFLPSQNLIAVAGDKVTWLDEKQALVGAVSSEEWPALVKRARPFEVSADTLGA